MTTEQAPSIGAKTLNFDPDGQRVRQIIETPLEDPAMLATALEQAHLFAETIGATRTAVRALIPVDQTDLPNGFRREAMIPLSGAFEGLHFSYFGYNHPDRTSSVIGEEMDLLARVQERRVKTPAEILETTEARGFRLERLFGDLTVEDHARLVEMYGLSFTSYPFSIEDQITGMTSDPNTHVYAARSTQDGQLYAVAASEQMSLNTGNGSLIMREMGDSARIPGVNGLNAPLKLMLIAEAARDGADLVFCESRAALGAVNAVNHDIGMQHRGLLPKHTVISGPSDINEVERDGVNGQFGNLHVWALSGQQIQQIGAGVQTYYAAR